MTDKTATDKAYDVERPRGILSKKDRIYLTESNVEEVKSSKGRVTRSRIRDRIHHSILDMHLIANEVEQRDIDTVAEDLTIEEGEMIQAFVETIGDSATGGFSEFIQRIVEHEVEEQLKGFDVVTQETDE